MKQQSIFRPIIGASLIITLSALTILTVIMYRSLVSPIAPKAIADAVKVAELDINNQINNKQEAAIAMAIAIADYSEIKQGLLDGDRDPVAEKLQHVKDKFAAISQYKNISVHVVDAEKISFVKSWNVDSFGEVTVHPLIDKTFETKQVTGTLGVGGLGISVTGFAPILEDGKVLGVVTAVQGVASVVKSLKAQNRDWILILDDEYLKERYKGIPTMVRENPMFDTRYRLAHKSWFDPQAIEFAQKHRHAGVNGDETFAEIIGDRIFIDLPVKDELGKVMGRNLLIQDATPVLNEIASTSRFVWLIIAGVALLFMLISGVILWLVKHRIVSPLGHIVESIKHTIETGSFGKRMQVKNMDELGVLMDGFNRLLNNLEQIIGEANMVVGALAKGDCQQRMKQSYVGDLASLKDAVNISVSSVSDMMQELSVMMQAMQSGDFSQQVNVADSVQGGFRAMIMATKATSTTLNDMIADINRVMTQVSLGNFTERVASNAQGDLLVLKNAMNTTLDTLESVVAEMERTLDAQSKGQLSGRVQAACDGQLAQLKQSINLTSDKLQTVVKQVSRAGGEVAYLADQVYQGAQNLSDRVQQQASALEETTAAMEQMNEITQRSSRNTQEAAVLASDVRKKAVDGEKVMKDSIQAMSAIRESSAKIGDIVTLIDSIAFQTNLLALNAAVEAARAGEHGRGFAVVAGEVRALAQKSADAAQDIKALISNNVHHIEQGTRLADASGEMLLSITASIGQVSDVIAQIASASSEQALGISQVHTAVTDLDRVTQENAALSEETNAAAVSMKTQAEELQAAMSFFEPQQEGLPSPIRGLPNLTNE